MGRNHGTGRGRAAGILAVRGNKFSAIKTACAAAHKHDSKKEAT